MEKKWKDLYWAVVFIPAIIGMILGRIENVDPRSRFQKKIRNVRPPSWVFVVAWFLLYIMFGAAWAFALSDPESDNWIDDENCDVRIWIVYGVTLLLLYMWTPVFNRYPKGALFVLMLSLLGTVLCYTLSPLTSKILLAPLVVWLIFAGQMNFRIVA